MCAGISHEARHGHRHHVRTVTGYGWHELPPSVPLIGGYLLAFLLRQPSRPTRVTHCWWEAACQPAGRYLCHKLRAIRHTSITCRLVVLIRAPLDSTIQTAIAVLERTRPSTILYAELADGQLCIRASASVSKRPSEEDCERRRPHGDVIYCIFDSTSDHRATSSFHHGFQEEGPFEGTFTVSVHFAATKTVLTGCEGHYPGR